MTFITFEGCDFCGKSTQIHLLKEYFKIRKKKVCVTREPGGTNLAEKIRKILLSYEEISDPLIEYLLLTAGRRDHVNRLIKKKLELGYYVLSDRFYDSSLCYQGYYKKLNCQTLQLINDIAISTFKPNITFLIDVNESEIESRMLTKEKVKNCYDIKTQNFYKEIRKGYLKIAYNNPYRINIIDGNQSIENVNNQIIKIIKQKLS